MKKTLIFAMAATMLMAVACKGKQQASESAIQQKVDDPVRFFLLYFDRTTAVCVAQGYL